MIGEFFKSAARRFSAIDDLFKLASSPASPQIPIPPAEFRRLVHGEPIGEEDHARIGDECFSVIKERCALRPSSTVLDIGCGCGRIATPMSSFLTSGIYHGVDIVRPMVDWCTDNISLRHPHFHFHHADLSNTVYRTSGKPADSYVFPFSDDTFDVIFAMSVFTHLLPASAAQYAREISRMLKPESGRALLTFFVTNDRWRETARSSFPTLYQCDGYSVTDKSNPEAVVAFEENDARRLLQQAGLHIEHLSFGQWSQNPNGWTYQDAFLVSVR